MSNFELNEDLLENKYPGIIKLLLKDNTTKKNIIFATSNYVKYGKGFSKKDYILPKHLLNQNKQIIKPRIFKNKIEQNKRIKDMAEVFTPSWVCNHQNNLIDYEFFNRKNVFNIESKTSWKKTKKVDFKNRDWKEYINQIRIEITCGEAPYLTSRYDVVSSFEIDPLNRIGLLDRKLRIVCENVNDIEEYNYYSLLSLKKIYGYDFQGDNVYLARKNLLYTYIDFYVLKFGILPTSNIVNEACKIITWNIFQMDGLKYVIPYSCKKIKELRISLFDDLEEHDTLCIGCKTGNIYKHNGIYAKIKDWKKNKSIRFIDALKDNK